ncbi:LpqB family beta-propeller domain-containing protein [Streptomyces clavuligerus]|nr:lipoprotein lpqB [Streptomyces clavuligerus]
MALSAGCGLLLLAGCASMPDSGEIRAVKASPRTDSQVRVEAVPPRKGATPLQVVEGFLEAMTSDDADFATAREYLAPEVSDKWQPEAGTTVLAEAPETGQAREGGSSNPGMDFPLHGRKIAQVDSQLAYEAFTPADYSRTIHLSQRKSQDGSDALEWRIDQLPPGLVLGASDFQRNYRPVNKYYFAVGRNTVVADPVFIRQRLDPSTLMDPVTQSVRSLLDGPTAELAPVVESSFPRGTRLKDGVALTFDDRNTLEVPLNEKANGVSRAQCDKMAAQILFTLKDLSSSRVDQVELQRANGGMLCAFSSGQEEAYAPDHLWPRAGNQYIVDGGGRLAVLPRDGQGVPSPVLGPLGREQQSTGQIAVARDEKTAAVVSADGRELRVAPIFSARTQIPPPLVRSKGAGPEQRLSAPSWDGLGDLWVADRDPGHGGLLRFAGGTGEPRPVRIVPEPDGARIESVRLSADGVRIALLLERDGRTTLQIGRVERTGPGDDPEVRVTALRPAAPQMETVTAVSWAGPSRLVVVGKEAGEVQQMRYIQTDGSTSAASVLPGLNNVEAVAASDDERLPLVAHSDGEGIVRLPSGANWQKVVSEGSSPVYPG